MKLYVFVNSIIKSAGGINIVEASNGKLEGPPFIRFEMSPTEISKCHIGKRYVVTVEADTNIEEGK